MNYIQYTREELLEMLCIYDERNPDNVLDEDCDPHRDPRDCFCDNCFYGRSHLANQLLSQIGYNN